MITIPIKKDPLHEIAYKWLKNGIIEGELRPGERLNQQALAEQLGISRMPIRDALRILENDDLVVNSKDKGYVVANFPKEKMRDLLFVRSILESKAVLFSKVGLTENDIEFMKNCIRESGAELEKRNWKNVRKRNMEFHFALYKACKSPLLLDMIDKLWHSFPKYVLQEEYETTRQSLEVHARILNYIQTDNFEAAANEMEKHIYHG